MRHVALLRGVNMLGNRRVDMRRLKELLESLGYARVTTYINSGNVLFESDKAPETLRRDIEKALRTAFGFDIPTLVKTQRDMRKIAAAIPAEWLSDTAQRSDVVYLFPEIDSRRLVATLPVDPLYVAVRYVKGAIVLNVNRTEYQKGRLNKLTAHTAFKFMTMRNVNTARFLAAYTGVPAVEASGRSIRSKRTANSAARSRTINRR